MLSSLAWAQGSRVRMDHGRTFSTQAFFPSEGWRLTSGNVPPPFFFWADSLVLIMCLRPCFILSGLLPLDPASAGCWDLLRDLPDAACLLRLQNTPPDLPIAVAHLLVRTPCDQMLEDLPLASPTVDCCRAATCCLFPHPCTLHSACHSGRLPSSCS